MDATKDPTAETQAVERHRFTADEFYQMVRGGVFGEDDRLELIEGEIFHMTPIGSKPAGRVIKLTELLTQRAKGRVLVSVQNPIRLGEHSEPQPDIALLRPRPDFYSESHPEAGDTLLAIEVADTFAEHDRTVKLPLYGRHGIPETWLVSLADGWVEVYTEPSSVGYRAVRRVLPGERLTPRAFLDVTLEVSENLG